MPKAIRRTAREKNEEVVQRLKKLPRYKTVQYMKQEERIKEAIRAWKDPAETEITNLRTSASIFDVPYSTCFDRYKGSKPLSENGGHNTRLNEAQEASLIWYIDTCIERNYPLRYDMVTAAATSILKATGQILSSTDRIRDIWALRQVEKQRKLGRYYAVCTKPMDYKRKDALTPELVLRYFSNLKAVKEKYDIHEGDQYNVDEIGFRVGCMRSTTVITYKNIKHVSKKLPY